LRHLLDPIDHYNRWQVPVAIFLCLLIGVGQFFRFKKTDWPVFKKKILPAVFISLAITGLCAIPLG